ncbi:MAG: OmpH family outer membrane protein, partial [Luteolibacter sp.]
GLPEQPNDLVSTSRPAYFIVSTSMNPLKPAFFALLATALTATAAPRFALVRVKDIYTSLPSTASLQQEIKKEREDIMKNERADQLRKIIGELQTLQTQLSDKTNPPDEATGRKLARDYEIKRQEAQTLQQEFESFKADKEKEINKRMVSGMRASLDRIVKISNKIAKEKGYDSVFDSSGDTNTGVPFVLYSKDAPDLTDNVQAALKDSEPAAAPKTAEKPAEKAPASH